MCSSRRFNTVTVAVFDDDDLPGRIARPAPTGVAVGAFKAWSGDAVESDMIIARLDPSEPRLLQAILDPARQAFFSGPIIVITPFCRASAIALAKIQVSEVVFHDELERRLPRMLLELKPRSTQARLSSLFMSQAQATPILSAAIRRVFTGAAPPHRVRELSEQLGCAESTLRKYWRDAGVLGTLHDLLSWGLLARHADHVVKGLTVATSAARLGVSESTLQRIARRYTGVSASGVTPSAVLTQLQRTMSLQPARIDPARSRGDIALRPG